MIHHRASILAGLVLLLASSCSQEGGQNATLPALPTTMTGSWTGVMGGATLVQFDVHERPGPAGPGQPAFVVEGSGSLVSGGCTQSVTVTGEGDGFEYSMQLVGNGTKSYLIDLFGTFQDGIYSGDYFMNLGLPADACISGAVGPFELGRTAEEGVEGTLTGTWTGADSVSFRGSQTSALVYGAMRWSVYACARDAFFVGTRSGDHVTGKLLPVGGSETSYNVSFDWDPELRTANGTFAITGVGLGSPCVVGSVGSFLLGPVESAVQAGPGGSAVSLTVLELGPEDSQPSVRARYEARE